MEPRDRNGLTESEFLREYKQEDYPRPSFTVDIALFCELNATMGSSAYTDSLNSFSSALKLLLIKRGGHPYLDCWALPGGFVNQDELADDAALREFAEETGVTGIPLEQLGTYSTPGRDPRGWTITSAFVAMINENVEVRAGDDAADAKWFTINVKRRQQVLTLTATCGDVVLKSRFEVLPQPFSTPRARILEAEGFAFDHAQIVADAYLRIS